MPLDMYYPNIHSPGSFPQTWEEGAEVAVRQVMESYENLKIAGVFDLLSFRELYDKKAFDVLAMKARFDLFWGEAEFLSLLARKQHDYGPENVLKFGQDGLEVRLWDKVARHENLIRRAGTDGLVNPSALNESVYDTLTDMIGYVTIMKMLELGWFKLPLAADRVIPETVFESACGGFGQARNNE